jgi:hypothetical protein
MLEWVEAESDIRMPEPATKLKAEKDVTAHPASLSRVLLKAGLSFKKDIAGLGSRARGRAPGARRWNVLRQPRMREGSIGWSSSTKPHDDEDDRRVRRVARLRAATPFGPWATQNLHRRTALRWPDRTMGGRPTARSSTLVSRPSSPRPAAGRRGDPRQSPSHKGANTKAEAILKQRGAWFLSLPPYSPGLKLKDAGYAPD